MGTLRPVTLKPAPITFAAEIVTLLPLEFTTVSDCDELLPSATHPKLMPTGVGLMSGLVAAAPVNAIFNAVPVLLLLVIAKVPVELLIVVGL